MVTNFVDQVAAGLGAKGAATSYASVKNDVTATIEKLAFVATDGNVLVTAQEDVTVYNTAVGVGVGVVGISGNVGINTLASHVQASITDNATVLAGNNVLVSASMVDKIASSSKGVAAGAFGEGGTSMINTFDNVSRAKIDNNSHVSAQGIGASLPIRKWDSQGNATNVHLNGLAVIAHSEEVPLGDPDGNGPINKTQINAYNAAGGLSGQASINAINIVNNHTEAYIASSDINSIDKIGNEVLVHAHSESLFHIHADGTAGGVSGSGGVSSRTFITNLTRAFVSDVDESGADPLPQPSVLLGKDIEISAVSREQIELDVNGVVGGGFALAGGISNAEIAVTTQTFTRDSQINSTGDLSILANDSSTITGRVGSQAIGGLAGGASIGFQSIENLVQAQVIGSKLFADDALEVIADSQETIDTEIYSLGAGLAGLAGTVTLSVIESTTEANVLAGDAATQINQDTPALPGLTLSQSVLIHADDDAKILNDQGTDSGGLVAGVGASVEFANIRDRTVATVGPQSKIYANGDVNITSDSSRQLDSNLNAFGGGALGLTGALSFLTLGAPTAGDVTAAMQEFLKQDDKNESLQSQTNKPAETPDLSSSIQDKPGTPGTSIAAAAAARVNSLADASVSGAITPGSSERITAALILDAPSAAQKSHIQAEGNLNIIAHNDYTIDQDVGSTAVGIIAVGASVAVTKVRQSTQADLGNFNTLASSGDVKIHAEDLNSSATPISISTHGGKFGAVGVDINMVDLTIDSKTNAAIGANAAIERGELIIVTAQQDASIDTDGEGFSGSVLASAGSVSVKPIITATVSALIEDGAQVGSQRSVGGLRVAATSTIDVENDVSVGAAAVVGGVGHGTALTEIKPTVAAHIADVDIDVRGNTIVDSLGIFISDSSIDALAVRVIGDG
ncbi:MAG: hypothetical protein IT423_07575, partial [Pirellulaceae bacterium]|nr:hypothetical protein [Pirellulaceae bacterium]